MNFTTNPSWLQDKRDLALLTLRSQHSGNWIDHDCIQPWKRLEFSIWMKCSIAVAWSPTTMNTASTEKATTLRCNPSKKFLHNTSGAVPWDDMYHEKFNPIKRGPNDNPEHPRHHINVRIFPIIFTKRCHTLELFHQANQGWRSKMSCSKDSIFWTLANR